MSSLLKRTLVLSFSRFANQAIVLISPVMLVRILPVGEYGGYREFMLYAGLIAQLVSFGISRSLPYFLPKYPEKEGVWVTQTILFILASTTVAMILIFAAGDLIRARTSFDFVTALQLYVIFFVNLDFLDSYWLGKKRTDYVLYYSSGRLIARIVVVIAAAVLTESAASIVFSLVVLEAVRCFLVLCYALSRKWLTLDLSRDTVALQAAYFLPLGAGGVIEVLNRRVGMLFVSAILGAEALAFYAIGTFATQIVSILRGAIADVIFPDIVELRTATPKEALPLWKRATVWYGILLFPMAILFSYYADAIVTVLFTKQYANAIPVFAALALLLIIDCFDFHLPLRVQNANRHFMAGSILALIGNVGLMYPLFLYFGLMGPAIALVVSRLILMVYLALHTCRIYTIGLKELVKWPELGKVMAASLLCAPILIAGKFAVDNLFIRGGLFGALFLGAYLVALRMLGAWDVTQVLRRLGSKKKAGLARG